MTITYTGKVANARLCAFSRLLFYWKGSIYKLMYKEMIIFCTLYSLLSLVYRLALTEPQKRFFEKIALHCETFANLIPLSFVLGFYVAICVTRWWNQYLNIPWPDRVMMYVTTMLDGADERSRMMRRSIMRYLSLASLIVFQATSVTVKKRFPTMDHLLDAGVITLSEIEAMNEVQTPHGKWWVPIVWICNLLKEARKEGRISDNYMMKTIMDEVQVFRGHLGTLFSYDWISVPLVYTQVTTLAVYTFFLGSVFGRQFLDPSQGYRGHEVDLYVPIFTLLQFFFYMGWLKVAEQLINPFGEDDDDFEINWIIDRNMQVSLIVADDMYQSLPKIEKDVFYDENPPDALPYTKSSLNTISKPHMGSTADLSVSHEGMQVVTPMETIQEDVAVDSHTNPNFLNPYQNSRCPSPTATPHHGRHIIPNMISGYHTPGMHTPFSISKSTLDGFKVDPKHGISAKHLIQTLNGPLAAKTHSYLENILHPGDDDFRSRLGSINERPGRHGLSPLSLSADHMKNPQTAANASSPVDIPSASLPTQGPLMHMATMRRPTSMASALPTATSSYSVVSTTPTPTPSYSISDYMPTGQFAPDVMTMSMESAKSETGQSDTCSVTLFENTPNDIKEKEQSLDDQKDRAEEQDQKFKQKGRFDVFTINETETVEEVQAKERRALLFNSGSNKSVASLQLEETSERQRNSSGHSSGSSNYSVDSNQATLTSLTPLLKTASSNGVGGHYV